MSTVTKLPAPTVLTGVSYDTYVRLRKHPGNRHLRMTYHDGILEIMSPEHRHEKGAVRLGLIVRAYAEVFEMRCESARSTTFRRGKRDELRGKGKEPDESFYFGDHAALVGEKDALNLKVDPPPDLWIEVDHRASSAGRLPVYAAFKVPELWRFRPLDRTLWIGILTDGRYAETDRSGCLPELTSTLILQLLDQATGQGETAWFRWMRGWMDENLRPAGR